MPCRWSEGGLGDFAGRVRFRRRFGYPGRIDAHERVWLTFAGIEGTATVVLNDQPLALASRSSALEFDVTNLLRPRNELVVDVEAAGGQGGLWGEVALEVRCTAYLRDVRTWREATPKGLFLHATGKVVGTAERPLDLYALFDGRTVLYTTVEALPEGKPFALTSELLSPEGDREDAIAHVELVNAATVWYAVETPAPLSRLP